MINKTLIYLVVIYKNLIETLYPINSEIDVYYNHKNPNYLIFYDIQKKLHRLMA